MLTPARAPKPQINCGFTPLIKLPLLPGLNLSGFELLLGQGLEFRPLASGNKP